MNTTVYRVEHRDTGDGPYIQHEDRETHYPIEGLHYAHGGSDDHPGPRGDYGIGWDFTSDHSFGFKSREQLDKWFKGFKRKLHAADFVIRVFEAPSETTFISEFQAIFIKAESKLVDTIPVVRYAKSTN